MNYPKCTLTDRELYETNPPMGRPTVFSDVAPIMFAHMRTMIDRAIKVMVDRGELAVPSEAAKAQAYLDLDKLAVSGMAYATAYRVNPKQTELFCKPAEPQKADPEVNVASPAQGTAGQWNAPTKAA